MTTASDARPLELRYICHEPLPSPHTNTEQIVKTAAALVGQGARVRLVFPHRSPTRGGAERLRASIGEFYGIAPATFEAGLELDPRPSPVGGNARRLWHDLTAVRAARRRGGVLYVRDPVAAVTALTTGWPVVFETFRVDLSRHVRFVLWRRYCLRHPRLVGVVTHSALAADGFRRAGVAADRLVVAHNGADPAARGADTTRGELRRALGCPEERRLVMYAGHLNRRKGVDALLVMAAQLPSHHFALIGAVPGSADAEWIARRLQEARLPNVSVHPRVPPARVPALLAAADVLVIPPSARPLENHHRTVLPLKTFQYLAAARPIVAPDLPDLREVLRDDHNAVLVPPDGAAAAAALARLEAEPERARRLAVQAAADARRYTWDARAAKILAFLRQRASPAGS